MRRLGTSLLNIKQTIYSGRFVSSSLCIILKTFSSSIQSTFSKHYKNPLITRWPKYAGYECSLFSMIFYTAGRETTCPLQSTLDSKRLSSRQIEKLSKLMTYHEWRSLACMLDVPIFDIRTYDPFEEERIVLTLYNKSRRFSRKKVVECCKEFRYFKEFSEILR